MSREWAFWFLVAGIFLFLLAPTAKIGAFLCSVCFGFAFKLSRKRRPPSGPEDKNNT